MSVGKPKAGNYPSLKHWLFKSSHGLATCGAQTVWRQVAEERVPGTVPLHLTCPVTAKATSDVHHITHPCAGGRNLSSQIATSNAQGFPQRDLHPPGSMPSDPVRQCLIEEMGLILGVSCTSAVVGQETPLAEFRHRPAGTMQKFNSQKGNVSTLLPAVEQRGRQHYLHADCEPVVSELILVCPSRPVKTTQKWILNPLLCKSSLQLPLPVSWIPLPSSQGTMGPGRWCFVAVTEVKYSLALIHPLIF